MGMGDNNNGGESGGICVGVSVCVCGGGGGDIRVYVCMSLWGRVRRGVMCVGMCGRDIFYTALTHV